MRAALLLCLLLLPALAQSAVEQAVMERANAARVEAGLKPLAFYPQLYQAGRAHAEDMLRRSYFGHEAPGGPNLFERLWEAGVFELKVAENLYELDGPYLPADLPERAVQGWLDSPGHRKNLLDPGFTHMAIAVLGQGNRYLVVQEFAYRPFVLSARREPDEGEAFEVALRGHATKPLGLVYKSHFLARFDPGPVSYEVTLPPGEDAVLVFDAGGYYQATRCPEDCAWLGVRLSTGRVRRPGYRVVVGVPEGRYLLAFGESPLFLGEEEGPFSLFAPRIWRFLWVGREGVFTHRIPLF